MTIRNERSLIRIFVRRREGGGEENIPQTMEAATGATAKSMTYITPSATVALQSPLRLGAEQQRGSRLGWKACGGRQLGKVLPLLFSHSPLSA